MRKRERERFLRMNFTEDELDMRNKLYKERNLASYKIVITQEHYDRKRKHADAAPPYDNYLAYFSDFPEDGDYVDTIYFYEPWQYNLIVKLYEGLFYQLFDLKTGKRIGYGSFDPDSPVEDIRGSGTGECCNVCELCFWRGMLYKEITVVEKHGESYFYCYNPNEKENWEKELERSW